MSQTTLSLWNKKITASTLTQYLGKIILLIISSLSLKFISTYLDEAGFSLYSTITEYVLLFSVAANLGIFGNLVRMMSDHPKDGKVFFNAFVLRVFTALVFLLIAIFWAVTHSDNTSFTIGVILFSTSLFFDFITSICDGMLQANYLMGRATFALILGRLVNFFILFLFTKTTVLAHLATGFEAQNIIFSLSILSSIITALLSIFFVSQQIKLKWSFDFDLLKKIFLLSLPFGLINISNNLYFRFLPDYYAHTYLNDQYFASFSISFRIAQVVSLVSTFLMFSALPALTACLDNKDFSAARKIFQKISKLLLLAGVMVVILGTIFGPWLISTLTHSKYSLEQLWFALPLMLALAAISYGYDLILLTIFAFKKDRWLLKREIIALLLSLLIFSLVPLISDIRLQLFTIIFAAIIAESFMVISGLLRIKKLFTQA